MSPLPASIIARMRRGRAGLVVRTLRTAARRALDRVHPPRFRMTIELTNKCNFRCTYCPHSTRGHDGAPNAGAGDDVNRFDRPQGFMSRETFDLALDNARRHADALSFSFFGEQTLHPRFAEWIGSIPADRPYRLVTNTNGSLLTPRNVEALLRFDVVRFSIDSCDSNSFEQLRPGGAVLTVEGRRGEDRFAALAGQIERWLSLPDHPETHLVYVTTDANRHERQRYLDHWLPKLSQSDCVIVKSVLSYGGVMHDPYMTVSPCTIPDDHRVNVAWNGDVTPCNLDVNVALCIGNIHETPDLRHMVASRRARGVMRSIRRREGICRNCRDANNHAESMLYWGLRGADAPAPARVLERDEVLAWREQHGHPRLRRAA